MSAGRRKLWIVAAVAGVAALAGGAQAAQAAQVSTYYTKIADLHGGNYAYFSAYYDAGAGETNNLTVTAKGDANNPLQFQDSGATITTTGNTVAVPSGYDGSAACNTLAHFAQCYEVDSPLYTAQNCGGSITSPLCPGTYLSGFSTVGITLGDGNDTLKLRLTPTTVPFTWATDGVDLGDGNDTVDSRDGAIEWIYCGPGTDTAIVDSVDNVAADCETVIRG